jgi:hypothetical protein
MVSLDIKLRPRNQVNDGVFYTFSGPYPEHHAPSPATISGFTVSGKASS